MLVLLIAAGACGDDPAAPRQLGTLEITRPFPSLFVGDTLALAVRPVASMPDSGAPPAPAEVVWTSTNETVATVDMLGVVTGRAPGATFIRATASRLGETEVELVVLARPVGVNRELSYIRGIPTGPGESRAELIVTSAAGEVRWVHGDSTETVLAYGWTADGERLLVTFEPLTPEGRTGSHLMRPDGTDAASLGIDARTPGFSPDGSRLAYLDGFDGPVTIAAADGTGATVVRDRGGTAGIDWSPDGRQVVWAVGSGGTTLEADLYVIAPGVEATPRRFAVLGFPSSPRWSPDGKTIGFGNGVAFAIASNGAGETLRNLFPTCILFGECPAIHGMTAPDWAPDARTVTYSGRTADDCFVFVVEVALLAAQMFQPAGCRAPVWSPDGEWIAAPLRDGEAEGPGVLLLRRDGSERRLIRAGEDPSGLRWRP